MSGLPTVEDVAWLGLDDPASAGAARRAVEELGRRLGLPARRLAEAGLAITEIATNVRRHAGSGNLLIRCVRTDPAAIEVVAIDHGPGIPHVGTARRDGYSTAGSLGVGLGAVDRLANRVDISSEPGRGTILIARFDASPPSAIVIPDEPWAEGLTRPLTGEAVCGDSYVVRSAGGELWLLMSDGSGHGPLAASASQLAVRTFREAELAGVAPLDVVERVHRALRGSRGAAVAVAALHPAAGVVRFAGLGNISGVIVSAESKRRMVSIGGVAGHQALALRSYDYPVPPTASVVLHSDGVRSTWNTAELGPLHQRPLMLAATLLRNAGDRHDDACVLVVKPTR